MYNDIREKHFSDHQTAHTSRLSDQNKAVQLLQSKNIKPVAAFVYESFETRQIMLDSLLTLNDMTKKIENMETLSRKFEIDAQATISKIITTIVKQENHDQKINKNTKQTYAITKMSNNGLRLTISKIPRPSDN